MLFELESGGEVAVTPYADDIVRVRFHWEGLWAKEEIAIAKPFDQWPVFSASFVNAEDVFRIITATLEIEIIKSPNFQIHFKDKSGFYLLEDYIIEYDESYSPLSDPTYYPSGGDNAPVRDLPEGFKFKSIKVMPEGEAYFGLGEFAGPSNRRGVNIQCWNQDNALYSDYVSPLYVSLPFFYGTRASNGERPAYAYGLFFNNSSRSAFKLGTQWNDRYSFEAADGQMDYFFFGGGTNHLMQDILSDYATLTGMPFMPPKWVLGNQQSRWSYDSQAWVESLVNEFRQRDFPLDVVYLDIGVQDSHHQLTFNSNFTNVLGLINYCKAQGVKLMPSIGTLLKTSDPLWPEAQAGSYFLKNNDGTTHIASNFIGEISWFDFSNTSTRNWWKGKLGDFFSTYPFPAVWNDLNEPNENQAPLDILFQLDGRYGDATDIRRWLLNNRNTYNIMDCSLTYEAMQESYPNQRPYVLSRSGWPGIQRYAAGWSGDNGSDFDNLRHNIGLGVSMMISGQANFGHDMGGFVGNAWGELLTRWSEYGIFMPMYRNHTVIGSNNQEPWVYGSPYTELIRDLIKFRYHLMPYLYSLVHESSTNGIPLNTPPVFHFMDDYKTHYMNDNDFMVGSSMLICPVVYEGATSRDCYLPKGVKWYNWHDDTKYIGGQSITMSAPLGAPPIFIRAGSIIPMGPAMKYVNEYQPTYLDIHAWPESHTTFTLYEDDGETYDYVTGEYAKTLLECERDAEYVNFTIRDRVGSYDVGIRDFFIILHNQRSISAVTINAAPIDFYADRVALEGVGTGWTYEQDSKRLIIKTPDNGTEKDIQITTVPQMSSPVIDFNGDGYEDLALYRRDLGWWHIRYNNGDGSFGREAFIDLGNGEMMPVPADYNGDGFTDPAVYHPGSGNWYVYDLQSGVLWTQNWGNYLMEPVPGDYNGDGQAEYATFEPSSGLWRILEPSGAIRTVQNGNYTVTPLPGKDFNGDGYDDPAVYLPLGGLWSVASGRTGTRIMMVNWGSPSDIPAPADYDGDGSVDRCIFRPSTSEWHAWLSDTQELKTWGPWGSHIHVPTPGYYSSTASAQLGVFGLDNQNHGWFSLKDFIFTSYYHFEPFGWSQTIPAGLYYLYY